jgi:hypothetical protein
VIFHSAQAAVLPKGFFASGFIAAKIYNLCS